MLNGGQEEKQMVLLNEGKVIPTVRSTRNRSGEENILYLDNGASNHMNGQRSKFKFFDEKVAGQVKFGDGSTINIKGKGLISLKCRNGEEQILKEVYFIPDLCANIISLGQLSKDGNKVILSAEHLWVYEKDGKLLMKVQKSTNQLYKIVIEEEMVVCLLTKAEEVSRLWHSRLGHVNFQAMHLMSSNHMAQ